MDAWGNVQARKTDARMHDVMGRHAMLENNVQGCRPADVRRHGDLHRRGDALRDAHILAMALPRCNHSSMESCAVESPSKMLSTTSSR
jgi:hypothetical protein